MADAAECDRDTRLRTALTGRRIVVTRAGDPGLSFVSRLAALGAVAEHCPSIAMSAPESFVALDCAIDGRLSYDWILFTSANAVHAFAARAVERLETTSIQLPPLAVVGDATAKALNTYQWPAHFVSRGGSGAALGRELPVVAGAQVLLPRADIASQDLPSVLRERDVVVDEVVAYRTSANADMSRAASLLRNRQVDAITFTSPSTVRYFFEGAQHAGCDPVQSRNDQAITIVCIGETTAAAARAHGLVPDAVSLTPSMEGMIDALAECFSEDAVAVERLNVPLSLL